VGILVSICFGNLFLWSNCSVYRRSQDVEMYVSHYIRSSLMNFAVGSCVHVWRYRLLSC